MKQPSPAEVRALRVVLRAAQRMERAYARTGFPGAALQMARAWGALFRALREHHQAVALRAAAQTEEGA